MATWLPRGICLEIEKFIRGFIWGDLAEHKKLHIVRWEEARKPIGKGGLGFRHLKSVNDAFLMKLGFQLIHENNKLWVNVLRAKYRWVGPIPICLQRTRCSRLWMGISRVWDAVRQGLVWSIRDDKSVDFWFDEWLDNVGCLASHANHGYTPSPIPVAYYEKMTGCGSEAQMCDSKPVMEKPEAVVVTEPVGLAPMETETGAAEVKHHVRGEESGRSKAQPLSGNPDSVQQQGVSDKNAGHKDQTKPRNIFVVLALPAAGVTVKDLLKSGKNRDAKFKDVEGKSVPETVTKPDEIKPDNGLGGSSSAETKVKPQDDANGVWGTEDEQAAFVKELEAFHKNNNLEFRRPKFYKQNLNLLKLWRAVGKLGGYEQVNRSKMWRQVGELFNPPKSCTSVSSTFRNYYEKALLKYEMQMHGVELPKPVPSAVDPIRAVPLHVEPITAVPSTAEPFTAFPYTVEPITAVPSTAEPFTAFPYTVEPITAVPSTAEPFTAFPYTVEPITAVPPPPRSTQAPGSSGVKRAAAAAHPMPSSHPIIKDKSSSPAPKSVHQPKTSGSLKRKTPPTVYDTAPVSILNPKRLQFGTKVVDIGATVDWITINVDKNDNSYCVYVLMPGNMHEEVNVQCDPEGRVVIFGAPKVVNNQWGIKPFRKILKLPSRIDPSKTQVVVSKTGRVKVIAPFEQAGAMK
ncbi:hypothetical protein GQ457_04G004250 [Hibiscus cannabinus]